MKTRNLIIPILAFLMLSSCGSRKNIIYFQDEPLEGDVTMSEPKQLIYKPDDILTINVAALDPDTVRPFNLSLVSGGTSDIVNARGGLQQQTYLVDYDGNIEFPVLGTLKIAGLTRTELTDMLTERISEYVTDPIVNVRLANFTVTILGEVRNPGTFTIQDERITILEALGLADDLTIFGKRKNVLLVREVDGKKKYAKIDLTTVNVVNSPVYYLQQNDVIYVEPNNAKIRSSTYNQNNSVLISAIGTLTTIVAVFLVK
ncbi:MULTISPECIES: polysaccharide biosynthesis/export family protein [Winogradskyella]|uniref:Polysaccharide export protein n=1 Tax=Winogradskyella ouciana TaxID=2608631 RepID=A0A7K1G8H6_9FLAO|nr:MULTISPECIES: polysaccharide biosynthesis/export family protein [Winogradskyella]MBO6880203.1 polysaccharide biosynthesis/export family protein [Winogradskyella sp.]MTE25576.1 polysaccharide export protein [Winogradskyella ouciana]